MKVTPAIVAAAVAGCALVGHGAPTSQPLENESELVIELQPLSGDAARLSFDVVSVAALRVDGGETPLEVDAREVRPGEARSQRPLARGRIPPGRYSGFSVGFAKPKLAEPGGAVDLMPPQVPLRVDAPFGVSRRDAVLLALQLKLPALPEHGGAFDPVLTAAQPARTLPALAGYVPDAESHELTVFDKRSRQVTAVLPTGRAPWGVAFDALENRAYVSLSGEDQIAIFDVQSGAEQNRIHLNTGDEPRQIALTPDRRLLLTANAGSNTVSFVDPAAMIEVGRVQVGLEPDSLLVDRTGSRAYVFNLRSSNVSVIDLANRAVIATLGTDQRPLRGQLDRAGTRLYVLAESSPFLTVYSLPGLAVQKRVYVGLGNSALKVDPLTDFIYVAKAGERRLSVYDAVSLIPVSSVEALDGIAYLAIDDAENALFALSPARGAIAVIELSHRKMTATLGAGRSARTFALMGERN